MSENGQRAVGPVVAGWWRRLHPDASGRGGDRGALARLRRAASPQEALLEGSVVQLHGEVCKALARDRLPEHQIEALATLAGVLAAVRPGDGAGGGAAPRFAAALGKNTGDRALMSPQRFTALLRAADWGERMRHLRRAVALLGNVRVDVVRFADDLFHWDDGTRRRWVFDYYQQAPAESGEPQTQEGVSA